MDKIVLPMLESMNYCVKLLPLGDPFLSSFTYLLAKIFDGSAFLNKNNANYRHASISLYFENLIEIG